MPLAAFCPRCGSPVSPIAPGAGRCTGCSRELFANPKPAAGALLERNGQVLLIRRGVEPGLGRWDIPGGFLNEGETAEQAVRREMREETGVELDGVRLASCDTNDTGNGTVLDLLFLADGFRGEPVASSDAAAIGWFPLGQLPPDLAFDSTRRLLARVIESRRGAPMRLLGGEPIEPDPQHRVAGFDTLSDAVPALLEIECGEWRIHDGALCGSVAGEQPAAAWFRPPVTGDHLLVFNACTVGPANNDINAFWEGSGQILGAGDVSATISGVAGWWDGFWGIERHPVGGLRTISRCGPCTPGRAYRIAVGRRGATDFLFVDNELVTQVDDATAPRRATSRVALATWNSHVHFFDAGLYRLPRK